MGTINATIRTRGIAGNEYPVIIRVIHNRTSMEVKVDNFHIQSHQWDATNQRVNPNKHNRASVINSAINNLKRSIEAAHDTLALAGRPFAVRDILDLALNKKAQTSGLFIDYIEEYITNNPDELGAGTLTVYKSTLLRWKEFQPKILTSDLNENHLIGYRKYLFSLGNTTNTVYNRMKTIRKMIRRAMNQGLINHNPFSRISLKQVKGDRSYLTLEELQNVIRCDPKSTNHALAKDIFIFSCYTGLRFSDMCRLAKENIEINGNTKRINFRMSKTSELLSFNLNNVASELIDKYMNEKDDLIFPMLRGNRNPLIESVIGSKNAMLNAYLKEIIAECGIDKSISMHCGRHSFSVNSLTMGGDVYVLSKLLGHTSLATTEIYAKAVDKRKDELTSLWNKN